MRGIFLGNKVVRTEEFITRLADKGYTKKDSAVVIADVLDVIYEAIANGEEVSLIRFGSFRPFETKPKRIMNVTTGKISMTRPHKKVRFVPGCGLLRAAEGQYRPVK